MTVLRTDEDTMDEPDRAAEMSAASHRPRWVKVMGIIIGTVLILFVIVMLAGGPGEHGPGPHGAGRGFNRAENVAMQGHSG